MVQAKKNFKKDNPALSFISAPEAAKDEQGATATSKAPEGYKVNPEFIEVKSKRVQLLLQPSIADRIKELARKKGLSTNEAINEAIKEYLQREEN